MSACLFSFIDWSTMVRYIFIATVENYDIYYKHFQCARRLASRPFQISFTHISGIGILLKEYIYDVNMRKLPDVSFDSALIVLSQMNSAIRSISVIFFCAISTEKQRDKDGGEQDLS